MKQFDESTELLIDLLEGALQEDGYEVVRYSNSKKHGCTSYDTLALKRDNEYFKIAIDKDVDYKSINPYKCDYKAGDTFESIKKEIEEREVQGNE